MMTTEQTRRYWECRRAGCYPPNAIRQARTPVDPTWDLEPGEPQTCPETGIAFTLRVEPDLDSRVTDWLGEWSDEWQEGAVLNPSAGWVADDRSGHWERYKTSRHAYGYFIPETSEAEHYRTYRHAKYGKTRARELARSHTQGLLDTLRTYEPVVLIVDAKLSGVTLGSAAVGGVDGSDENPAWDYIDELVWEARRDALDKIDAINEAVERTTNEILAGGDNE